MNCLFNKIEEKFKSNNNFKETLDSLNDKEKNNLIKWINKNMGNNKKLKIYTDGASRGNPGQAGYGFVIKNNHENIKKGSGYLGVKTNNQAEYLALEKAIKSIKKLNENIDEIMINMDSQLIVRQFKGVYRVKNKKLKKIYNRIKKLLAGIKTVEFKHIPREKNKEADELANIGIDNNI